MLKQWLSDLWTRMRGAPAEITVIVCVPPDIDPARIHCELKNGSRYPLEVRMAIANTDRRWN